MRYRDVPAVPLALATLLVLAWGGSSEGLLSNGPAAAWRSYYRDGCGGAYGHIWPNTFGKLKRATWSETLRAMSFAPEVVGPCTTRRIRMLSGVSPF
jgi:hypothetical protein